MLRKFAILVLLSFAVAGWAVAGKPDATPPVTIMTQNMDDGTDQTYVIGALTGALSIDEGVYLTYLELQFSLFSLRADLMAGEIAARRPDLVAVQEAALWRGGPTPETATNVIFDQLDLLVSALRSKGIPYDVVAVNRLSDLALPSALIGGALRFTDRNAVLIRADLRPPQFHLSNVHANTFDAALPFAGLTVTAGWISADVHMGNKQFRFVTTHLESPIPGPGYEGSVQVQVAQAQELIHELRNLTVPVVICGDFNADAAHSGGLEDTPTVDLIEAAGYKEVWPVTHSATSGLTWPFYKEDLIPPPPFFGPSTPTERIDLFFTKKMAVVGSEIVATPTGAAPELPQYASDHAGVIATFRP